MHYLIRLKNNDNSIEEELIDDFSILDEYLIPNSTDLKGLLRHIDPYGTTCFNGLQAEEIIDEIKKINISKFNHEQKISFNVFLNLCKKCKDEVHKSLWIYGD